jgi:hypothetical protein
MSDLCFFFFFLVELGLEVGALYLQNRPFCLFVCFCFCSTGFELRASCLVALSPSTSPVFVLGIFEIGSHEVFA